jgi:hypothetical protein
MVIKAPSSAQFVVFMGDALRASEDPMSLLGFDSLSEALDDFEGTISIGVSSMSCRIELTVVTFTTIDDVFVTEAISDVFGLDDVLAFVVVSLEASKDGFAEVKVCGIVPAAVV